MKISDHKRWLVVCAGAALSWSAAAQATASVATEDLEDFSLEQLLEVKVVSASKFEQRGRDAPSAVQVIGREEIRRHGWRTLSEALNTLPGLYVTNDKAYDFQGARGFQITGDYNTRFLLLIDGQRNNDNIYESALTGSEGWLDMSAIERIEYIPGPGSALYGANAMFGVINVITRQGDEAGRGEVGLRVSESYGAGVNLVASQVIKGTEANTRIFLQYSADHKAGSNTTYSDPLGQLVQPDGSVSPNGVANGLDGMRNRHLMAHVDRGEISVRLISHERTVNPSAANYSTLFNDPSLSVTDGGTQLNVSLDHKINDQSRLFARLGYTDYFYRGVYPFNDTTLGNYRNIDDTRGKVLEGELRYLWRTGDHQWVTGLELSRDLLANQTNTNSIPSATLGTQDVDINYLATRSAVFLQDAWQVSQAWQLNWGGRLDAVTDQTTNFSPRLGLIWQASPDWTFKFLSGRAYRRPNLYESQYTNNINYTNNLALQPETIRTTEGVMEWRSNPNSRVQLSVYQNQLGNLIQQVDSNGAGLFQFKNLASLTIQGAELGVEQKYLDNSNLRASLAVNKATNSSGASVDNSPGWLAKASGSTSFLSNTMILAGELQVVGPRDYSWNGNAYSVPLEILTHMTATFSHPEAKRWRGQVRITNLLNRAISHPASEEIPTPLVPQPARQLSAVLTYAF